MAKKSGYPLKTIIPTLKQEAKQLLCSTPERDMKGIFLAFVCHVLKCGSERQTVLKEEMWESDVYR
jgi:hypothetical protein